MSFNFSEGEIKMLFCMHKWSKWSRTISNYGLNLTQVKECKKCGMIKSRTVWVQQLGGNESQKVNDALASKGEE